MCQSCEALTINGVLCHESGCPDAWENELRECPECGCEFEPNYREQRFCTEDCADMFFGI